MTIIEKKSFIGYLLSRRFIIFFTVCVCLAVILGFVYYRSEKSLDSVNNDTSTIIETTTQKIINWTENEEINIFREYLRIRTDHPNINYEPCVEFLTRLANELDLPVSIYYPVNKQNPIVVMTLEGSEPNWPSILLNSHMDVVPAFNEYWTHPPFAADIDENGNIYGRGAQDMKCIGMLYLAAIRALKRDGIQQFKRTIHVTFVPDEEMGSHNGMREFVRTAEFKALNAVFALDEGAPPRKGYLKYFFAEKATWRMEFICRGNSGHGSSMLENTAAVKLFYIINKFNELRKIELEKQQIGDRNVTSINLTVIKGGVEGNVIPPEMSAIFDVRLAVDADHDAFEKMINRWCEEAGDNITINYQIKDPKAVATVINSTNQFWTVFTDAINQSNLIVEPSIAAGATDSRFLRSVGVSAFGFSPLFNTIIKVHDNDEYLNAETYLTGIEIYKKIIPSLANVDHTDVK